MTPQRNAKPERTESLGTLQQSLGNCERVAAKDPLTARASGGYPSLSLSAWGHPPIYAPVIGSPVGHATPVPRSIAAMAAMSSSSNANEKRSAFSRIRSGDVLFGSTA